jgi:hypothetical protein
MDVADIPRATRDGQAVERPSLAKAWVRAPSRIVTVMSLALLAWSVVEVVGLAGRHTTGPQLYGVLVAGLAVVAASLALFGVRSTSRQAWFAIAVAVVWVIVAIGGVAGVVAHVVGPLPGEGPVDSRPRPALAPLAFTAMGVVGELVLWIWWRRPVRASAATDKGAIR